MPDGCVVDTDVVSYLFKRDTRAQVFQPLVMDSLPVVSLMTVAELEQWVRHRNLGERRREELATFVDQFAIVMVDRALCRIWAEVADRARRNGRPIQVADAWIAATAVTLGVPLVTNNRDDSRGVDGLRLLPDAAT